MALSYKGLFRFALLYPRTLEQTIKYPQVNRNIFSPRFLNTTTPIEITDRAVKKLLSITKHDHNNSNSNTNDNALRIRVDSGGCHGFQYFYDLVETKSLKSDDMVFEKNGAKVIVDEISLGLIKGSKIDYTEELIGSQFQVIDNPQAISGCGCGVSFEVKS